MSNPENQPNNQKEVKIGEWMYPFADHANTPYFMKNERMTQKDFRPEFDKKIGEFRIYMIWRSEELLEEYEEDMEKTFTDHIQHMLLPGKIVSEDLNIKSKIDIEKKLNSHLVSFFMLGNSWEVNRGKFRMEVGLDDQPIFTQEVNVSDIFLRVGTHGVSCQTVVGESGWERVKSSRPTEDLEFEQVNSMSTKGTLYLPEDPRFLSQVQIRIVPSDESRIMNHESR